MDTAPMSFVQAVMHFFGKKPNQTTQEFAAELRAATSDPADKAYFHSALSEYGYKLTT